ncbi:hypothetical protein FRB93_004684 [Tulasnella sp. JGI-2019a]|nr:hypothetical protein FRB93_004684 [Tulasnella sp. JGI-2019a]
MQSTTPHQRKDNKPNPKRIKAAKHKKINKGLPVGAIAGIRRGKNDKDDEERYLESVLFGVPFVPEVRRDRVELERVLKEHVGGSGLEHVVDEDLFFADSGVPESSVVLNRQAGEESSDSEAEAVDEDASWAESRRERGPPSTQTPFIFASQPADPSSSKSKRPTWVDPSDANIQVSLANDKRLRKLREDPADDIVSGKQYEMKLREQFERINPVPAWTIAAREKLHGKRKRTRRSSSSSTSSSRSDNVPEVDHLLQATGDIIESSNRPKLLPPTQLMVHRLRDANQAARSESEVSSVRFHPSPTVPVLLTAGTDWRLRLFNIDGLTNPLLQTLHTPSLPITNAQFHPSGQSVLLTGARPYYVCYDLQSGAAIQSPRGIWSSAVSSSTDGMADGDRSMEISRFSDDGRMLAVAGRRGHIHILDWGKGSSGANGQIITTLKMNSGVKDLVWCGSAGSGTGILGDTGSMIGGSRRPQLMSISNEGEVYVWDVGSRKCVKTWRDDSAFGASTITIGGNGTYCAIGASTGIVNVYDSEASTTTPMSTAIRPLKAITNLTTPISTVRFDPTCQIMAIAGRQKKDELRMIHLPSLTVFANWPTAGTPLGHVTSVDFSVGSEYVAIGNHRGRVLLYNLKHFGAH